MKCFALITVLLALQLITAARAAADATVKPFVRSRYSRRWQRLYATTDSAADVALLNRTTGTTQEVPSRGPSRSLEAEVTTLATSVALLNATIMPVSESTPAPPLPTNSQKNEVQLDVSTYKAVTTSTEHPRQNASNMPTDYDYYGNGGDADDDSNHKYD